MKSFLRNRSPSLAVVVLILFAISLAQGGISYTMTLGALRGFLSSDVSLLTTGLIGLKFGFVTALGVLWLFKFKHALFQLIILVNAWFTLALLGDTSALISSLFWTASGGFLAMPITCSSRSRTASHSAQSPRCR